MPNVEQAWIALHKTAGITTTRSWIVSDSAEITTYADELNSNINRSHRKHVELSTFDFGSLYTEIKLDDLGTRINMVIDLAFGEYTHIMLMAGKHVELSKGPPANAPPAQRKGPKIKYVSKATLKEAVKVLINNTNFQVGTRLFQQMIGIPMGTNCAVFIANLFLFSYEYEFIEHCINKQRLATLYADSASHGGTLTTSSRPTAPTSSNSPQTLSTLLCWPSTRSTSS